MALHCRSSGSSKQTITRACSGKFKNRESLCTFFVHSSCFVDCISLSPSLCFFLCLFFFVFPLPPPSLGRIVLSYLKLSQTKFCFLVLSFIPFTFTFTLMKQASSSLVHSSSLPFPEHGYLGWFPTIGIDLLPPFSSNIRDPIMAKKSRKGGVFENGHVGGAVGVHLTSLLFYVDIL